jgi:hypothetical protein
MSRFSSESGLRPDSGLSAARRDQIFETTTLVPEQEPVEGPPSSSRCPLVVLCGHLGQTLAGACLSAETHVLHSKPD